VPVISNFYGIEIQMFADDHSPPHFHASYGDDELLVGISPIRILRGAAPPRVRSMVLEWAAMHHQELLDNWKRCETPAQPLPIAPLE
jgi:Domain of unknown function (DUF4160)